ncbi:MAG TPA: hypothetical protein VGL84_01800 [Gaiellaceae bacterium]|jgi:hypothetical protein
MDVELEPQQPDEVAKEVAALLTASEQAPDPWWQAGIDEALEDA